LPSAFGCALGELFDPTRRQSLLALLALKGRI